VEYLECETVTVCASRSVARRRIVERENPSACGTVDCKFYKREITLYSLCVSVIMSDCITNRINRIVRTRTLLISDIHVTIY
jgi:hypothetical protein